MRKPCSLSETFLFLCLLGAYERWFCLTSVEYGWCILVRNHSPGREKNEHLKPLRPPDMGPAGNISRCQVCSKVLQNVHEGLIVFLKIFVKHLLGIYLPAYGVRTACRSWFSPWESPWLNPDQAWEPVPFSLPAEPFRQPHGRSRLGRGPAECAGDLDSLCCLTLRASEHDLIHLFNGYWPLCLEGA